MQSAKSTAAPHAFAALAIFGASVSLIGSPVFAQSKAVPTTATANASAMAPSRPPNAAGIATGDSIAPVVSKTPVTGSVAPTLVPGVSESLDITSAEKISVKIQGQPELSGDYRIGDDQSISIPVLGRVSVAKLNAAALEKVLAERIARLVGREAFVTVEVVEYRPVFISGYVSRPGSSPWKPGMTTLQAVTISGGTFRGANSNGIDGGASTKLQRTIDDQKRVLATIARLTSERAGAATIALPPRLIALVGRKEAQELIDAQMTSFLSRKNATEAQVASLERSIALSKEELASVRAQRQRLADQLKFRQKQFAQLKVLYDKQFLRIDRLSEEEIKISDLEEKVASLGVTISRTDGSLVGMQRDLANIRQDRSATIDTDLLRLERDSAQLELEIEAAGPTTRVVRRPLADSEGPKAEVIVYEIVRHESAGPKTLPADRNTLLRPGDMLVVSVQ
jgi:protein involved in polysaccharide export with SLBB domain